MSNIVKVPFHGDELLAAQDERGVWVPLKRMCEALGLQPHGQSEKLKTKPWAVTQMICATGPDGKTYETLSLHLDSVPMWLATIEPSRVDESVRAKLVVYQRECAAVLRDHFFGRRDVAHSTPFDAVSIVRAIGEQFAAALVEMNERAERRAATLELRILDTIDRRFTAIADGTPLNGTIGRTGALRVRAALREYADMFTGEERRSTAWKSCHKRADNELRKSVSFTIRAWGLMPATKDVDTAARLDDMLRTAREVAHQRQAIRAKQMGINFEPSNNGDRGAA
jgi:hypothetical protein